MPIEFICHTNSRFNQFRDKEENGKRGACPGTYSFSIFPKILMATIERL